MPLRPVPWAIGNGAENSVELARAGLYIGSSGATGIVEPTDFRVTALPTPGAFVRVNKGTGVIKSTYAGVFGQAYGVQEQSYTDVPVTATGSTGGATKYVYVLIEDHQYAGMPTPPSIPNGPYNRYAVTTSLPQNQPYLLLAQINQPASTATIQQNMIVDRREVANPRRMSVRRIRPTLSGEGEWAQATGVDGEWFPNNGGEQLVDVPAWATRALIRADWLSVRYEAARNGYGEMWVEFGPYLRPSTRKYTTQRFMWDTAGATANTYRTNWMIAADVYIPADIRGTTQTFVMKARKDVNSQTAASIDGMSGVVLDVEFLQVADPSTS